EWGRADALLGEFLDASYTWERVVEVMEVLGELGECGGMDGAELEPLLRRLADARDAVAAP
ncbi:hypothetical protein, partial [Streptomyces lunaelactis]|uniref:hypothetical protein n=1 Tax=Streptomyces lunaelactis TaxID=1535768 RepID=UPI0015845CE9